MTEEQINFQHPAVLGAIQNRLNTLIGKSSGYIESLPEPVQGRVKTLEELQGQSDKLESALQRDIMALEKKYALLAQPIYDQRTAVIVGTESEEPRGIPEFWCTALKNLPMVSELITENDEAVLKSLTNIKAVHLDDNHGFRLEFSFAKNDYFENEVLTKTYYLLEATDEIHGDVVYDHAEGTPIAWKEDKDLSVKIEIKKQKHKGTGKTRTVKKTIPCETFFSFFKPPTPPTDEDDVEDEDELDNLDEKLEYDYELGEEIKEKLIPNAVHWFTGEALRYEQEDDEEDDFDEEDDEDQEDAEDDEDDEPVNQMQPSGDKPPECKQQ